MGFLDVLRGRTARLSEGDASPTLKKLAEPELNSILDQGASPFDRTQWHKKLKKILEHLPESEPQWADLTQEAHALRFSEDWIAQTYRQEFALMIHKVVSDQKVTSEEHRNVELARRLMGIPEREAEAILHQVVAEAEEFFGKPIEGA